MGKQIITIHPDGSLSGLHHKKGMSLHRVFGDAEIRRVSEILWSKDSQKWFVKVLDKNIVAWMTETWPTESPGTLTWDHWMAATDQRRVLGQGNEMPGGASVLVGVLYFDEYEEAVQAEIDFLNALRLRGVL